MSNTEFDVIVSGAGPVGLCLALDLAGNGARVLVLERKPEGFMPTVRCNHIAARSMEIFRRLGLARKIRDSGLPADYDQSVSYRTTTVGAELSRIRIPARSERFTALDDGPDSWWPTPEPPHRMNQIYLEPILVDAVRQEAKIELRYDTELIDVAQDETQVVAQIRSAMQTSAVTGRFLVGCDGGKSFVRKAIGASLQGDAQVMRVQSSYIRAPALVDSMSETPTWAMFSMNPRRTGNIYSIDGKETYLLHNYLRADEPEFDSVDRDACIREILGVDRSFQYEVIANEDWIGRRLVADKVREKRVFICGDAAHIWVPFAGYGMNAGIADAANLAWLLTSVLQGWGGEIMLDAYEAERLPITEQVSRYAMSHAVALSKQRSAVPDNIEDDTPAGQIARKKMGEEAYRLNVQQYCCAGLNFGYFYDDSPIIVPDGATPPEYSMSDFTVSSVPGCRVPHFWLSSTESLLDKLGTGYVLIRTDESVDVSSFEQWANDRMMPFSILDVAPPPDVAGHYPEPLVLVRPDHHVAWRGRTLSSKQTDRVMQVVTGRARQV
ncbi:MAG: FAD-dependent monooxygenase [Burkholderiaceae bacterium]